MKLLATFLTIKNCWKEANKIELDEAIEVLKDFEKQVKVKSDGAYQTDKGMCACMLAIDALEK